MDYQEFLNSKKTVVQPAGFDVELTAINPKLFGFQRDIVRWAIWKGRAAIFADCGLGKTFMQLEWARLVMEKTGKPVLIVAPLAVSGQTIHEATKLGVTLSYVRKQLDADGVTMNITNYEMTDHFHLENYGGIVLDESSILKNFTGKTKQILIRKAQAVNYRLACTATPAPNDHLELGNHAEFLGVMRSNEMIQRWFRNDAMHAGGYVLKAHGADDFWAWVASWAVALRWPSDIGQYNDDGYILPELVFNPHIIAVDHMRAWDEVDDRGQASLLITGRTSATNMHREKRATLKQRMAKAAELALYHAANDYVIVWCETNIEADELRRLMPEAVEVRGNEPLDIKRQKLEDFSNGKIRLLITKPKIAAHGLNWQHAGTQIWTSITHKFEPFYQGYKRSHRFGRTEPVTCHIVYAESEGDILENLTTKHEAHVEMQTRMVEAMQQNGMSLEIGGHLRIFADNARVERGRDWTIYNGDSAVALQNEPDNSLDFIVQSPPFESIYIYSSHVEDLGNSTNHDQFYHQYGYILRDELRRLKPGTYKAEHCKDLPLYRGRDGAMGLDDFPGRLITAHLAAGFWFVGWKTVWKDPVIEMQRTKNAGLLWSSAFCQRAERARQGMADYVLIFQKPIPGEVAPGLTASAAPVPSMVIDRCVDLWANFGEAILKPYGRMAEDDTQYGLIFSDLIPHDYQSSIARLMDGRNLVIRVSDPAQMHVLIAGMKRHDMVFHSRVALTDGTWLLVFRKWVEAMPEDTHVTHDLKADSHTFIGNSGPAFWNNDRDYSIQVWQRYASPVWFDLDGLPMSHPDIWVDIDQTNVLNHRIAREDKDEKHICPLQLDLIRKCILQYTRPGDLVGTSFAGVGSEMVTAIKLGRRSVGCELKESYFDLACEHLRRTEAEIAMPSLFDFAGLAF
jgi:superfamily II DNA or RNA helicase